MSTPFTAALLAGGKSTRCGRDKAALEWEGRALWQRQVELLESLGPEKILISGQPNGPYVGSKYEVVFDHETTLGPLAGFNALLLSCKTPRLLILSVDMPWMTREVLEQLLSFEGGTVPECQGWWEGTAAVYPVDILPLVRNTLRSPNRSVQALILLALNNGFIDTWKPPCELERCFQSWDGSSLPATSSGI